MSESWAAMTKRIMAMVEAIAAIKPGSRFDQMRRMFIKDDGSPQDSLPPGHPDLPIAREAIRDITQLNFIHEQLVLGAAHSDFSRRCGALCFGEPASNLKIQPENEEPRQVLCRGSPLTGGAPVW